MPPLCISPEEEIWLPRMLLWLLVCYKKTSENQIGKADKEHVTKPSGMLLLCVLHQLAVKPQGWERTTLDVYGYDFHVTICSFWTHFFYVFCLYCIYSTISWLKSQLSLLSFTVSQWWSDHDSPSLIKPIIHIHSGKANPNTTIGDGTNRKEQLRHSPKACMTLL